MDNKERLEEMKDEYRMVKIPENGLRNMEEAMKRAKEDKIKMKKTKRTAKIRNWGIAAAAACMAAFILPNSSASIANAMGNLPVIGGLFKVITIRDYEYDDGNHQANVKVPQVTIEAEEDAAAGRESADIINKSVEEYTNELLSRFETEIAENVEGHQGLEVSYETITDTDTWFTLLINALDIQASSYEYRKYYHIDKKTGQTAELKDIFKEGSDYVNTISEEIKRQMEEQMQADENMIYFYQNEELPEGNFEQIKADQNFYFDAEGKLVIVFDEYEVAPGYMGCPEFVIGNDVTESILR